MNRQINKLVQVGMMTFCVILLSACARPSGEVQDQARAVSNAPLGNVEFHTAELADELFANLKTNSRYRYAVVGFVPVAELAFNGQNQHPLMLLGHQLEQGLMTEAARRGLITQDYKTTNDIILSHDSERVFSRKVEELAAIQQIDFFISGTITEQQDGAIVNARIINRKNKNVVAAATKFFPAELFWKRENTTSRNGMIYRTGTE